MGKVTFRNIKKVYPGGVQAVYDFNLEIEDKEFIVFVGPSGCGKSTVLRMVAGLEEITDGEIAIDEKVVNQVLPKDRDIAMVFQNYALYPHMTVYDNISMGLKLRKVNKVEIKDKVMQAAKAIEIESLLDRKPKALSGGQQQRVALARAIVRNPNVFLMDEPLSNLDAKLRVQMRTEIIDLHQRIGTTFIYVTHDQVEAMTMGTRIVVMNEGVIQQVDTPMAIYQKPVNQFVAGFIGTPQMNFLSVTLDVESGRLEVGAYSLALPNACTMALREKKLSTGNYVLGIRPEHVLLSPVEGALELEGKVHITEHLGAETLVHVALCDHKLTLKVPGNVVFQRGASLSVYLDTTKWHWFDVDSGNSIY